MFRERGFSLIELLIVVLIVGVLAAVASPMYYGYVLDAKTAEAKNLMGSIWTSLQHEAGGQCGIATPVSMTFQRAGLTDDGKSKPPPSRWAVESPANTLTVDCATGTYTASATPLVVLTGIHADVATIKVGLFYVAGDEPPIRMRCATNGTAVAVSSPTCS